MENTPGVTSDASIVSPVIDSSANESPSAPEAIASNMTDMFVSDPSLPTASPAETRETPADTSTGVKQVGQQAVESKVPEAIPYSRFKEKVDEYNQLKQTTQTYEELLRDQSALKQYIAASFNDGTETGDKQIPAEQTSQSNALRDQVSALNPFDENYDKQLTSLFEKNNQSVKQEIVNMLYQERQDAQLIAQQESVLEGVFAGRPPEHKQNALNFLMDWSSKNAGAKFPITGNEGWKFIDQIANKTNSILIDQARKDALSTEEGKRLLDAGGGSNSVPAGSAMPDRFADMFK